MKRIVLAACAILAGISALQAEGVRGRPNKDVDLVLYSLVGVSLFEIDGANQDARFEDIPDCPVIADVGAGFFLRMGDRFAYGADYLYGQYGEFRIIESPVFVQYTIIAVGPVSFAPQIGFTFGNAQISSFDPGNGARNATIITSNYLTGRLGGAVNVSFGNGIYLGVKGGYSLPLLPEEDWSVRGSSEDFAWGDQLGQYHVALMVGTTKSLVGRD